MRVIEQKLSEVRCSDEVGQTGDLSSGLVNRFNSHYGAGVIRKLVASRNLEEPNRTMAVCAVCSQTSRMRKPQVEAEGL